MQEKCPFIAKNEWHAAITRLNCRTSDNIKTILAIQMAENNFEITKVHNVLNEILNPSVYELTILLR